MLTRNREKRKCSDKHGGQATNTIPEHSTVSRNDDVEFEEELTMDKKGSSAGVDDGRERSDFRYGAWLLREKLDGLVDGNHVEPPELEVRSLLNIVASRYIISEDPNMLNLVLWRTLPKELLHFVFARLPVRDITRLRSLSREWYKDMATVNSEINQACDESSPIMVASLLWFGSTSWWDGGRSFNSEFLVTICTQRSHLSYVLHLGDPIPGKNRWDHMGARDGGLACFVSTWKPSEANPLCIVVVNLLTRVRHRLPPLQYVYSTPPKMMHIEVDSESKCYKVVVVGKRVKGHLTVEMYDSGARQWTKATTALGFIFGLAYKWIDDSGYYGTFKSACIIRSVCDLAIGELKLCDEKGPSKGASVLRYVVQEDCMFLLHRNTGFKDEILLVGGYCITKYRVQNNLKDWVQERSYLCSPFEALSETECRWMTLKACEGFLMVFSDINGRGCEHFWLLDLSTGEWSSLPNGFEKDEFVFRTWVTKASWNVVP